MEILKIVLNNGSIDKVTNLEENRHAYALKKMADKYDVAYSAISEVEIMKSLTKSGITLFLNMGIIDGKVNMIISLPNNLSEAQKQYFNNENEKIQSYSIYRVYKYDYSTNKLKNMSYDYQIEFGKSPENMMDVLYYSINEEPIDKKLKP